MNKPLRPEDFVEAGPRIRMTQIWGDGLDDEPEHQTWIAQLAADEVARVQAESLALSESQAHSAPAVTTHNSPLRELAAQFADEPLQPSAPLDELVMRRQATLDAKAEIKAEALEKARADAAHDDMVKIKRATWLLSGLTATLVLVSVVLVATSIQMWRARSEVQAIEQRLATLEAFETRIVGRLDSFNTGIQNLIGKTNDVFYKTRAQVEETATVSRTAAGDIATSLTELQDMMTNLQSQPIAPVEAPVRRRVPGAGQAVAAQPAAMPPASKAFERIVNSDGSTTYRHTR